MHSFKQLGTKITSKKMILNFFDFATNFDETTTLTMACVFSSVISPFLTKQEEKGVS